MPRPIASAAAAFVLGAIAVVALAGSAAPAPPSGERVEVESERLTIDRAARRARFEGKVVARFRDLELTCAEMTATYDAAGAIASLEAKGRVAVRRGDAVAEAGRAALDVARRVLVLEGSPTVTRGAQRLSGARIEVSLDTGAVEVLEARGTFVLPIGSAR